MKLIPSRQRKNHINAATTSTDRNILVMSGPYWIHWILSLHEIQPNFHVASGEKGKIVMFYL
jgi:hypothetical protein